MRTKGFPKGPFNSCDHIGSRNLIFNAAFGTNLGQRRLFSTVDDRLSDAAVKNNPVNFFALGTIVFPDIG